MKKLNIGYEEKKKKNHLKQEKNKENFRTRNKSTRNLKNNLKETKKKIQFFSFHFNRKWHCFYMWVLHVGINSSTIISICHNRQYLYVTYNRC
jgi:hypothetical protein